MWGKGADLQTEQELASELAQVRRPGVEVVPVVSQCRGTQTAVGDQAALARLPPRPLSPNATVSESFHERDPLPEPKPGQPRCRTGN